MNSSYFLIYDASPSPTSPVFHSSSLPLMSRPSLRYTGQTVESISDGRKSRRRLGQCRSPKPWQKTPNTSSQKSTQPTQTTQQAAKGKQPRLI